MIENSLYCALTAVFLFGLPFYQKLIKSRLKRVEICETNTSDYDCDLMYSMYPNAQYEHMYKEGEIKSFQSITGLNWYEIKETNIFYRKPFTCLLCMTFWGCIVRAIFILFICGDPISFEPFAPCLVAPVMAEAFNRWFKSLPISF